MTFDEIKTAQTANPPQYGPQGQVINAAPMTTPAAPPAAGAMGQSGQPVGTADPTTAPKPATTSSPFAMAQVMQALENQYKTNNTLMTQRNLVLKHLYDQPLTPDEMKQLDPSLQKSIQSGDRSQIDMSLRLISDQVAGRTQTLDQSMQFLVNSYTTEQKNIEDRKNQAISNVLSFVQQYGSKAGQALSALYGPDYLSQLKSMGIDVAAFSQINTPTITEQRYQAQYGAGGSLGITIPQGTLAFKNNNPGNLRFIGQTGATQGQGGFAAFSTPQDGFNALVQDIQFKQSGSSTNKVPDGPNKGQPLSGKTTLEDMIRIYAPSGDGNDPVGYAKQVADALGINPNTPISQIDPQDLATQIAKHESGTTIVTPDIQTIAQGIESGAIPPDLKGFYSKKGPITAQLVRDGFDLSKATMEWTATQKYISSANSTQQVRLKQAIDSVKQGIEGLRTVSQEWNAGGFAPLNAANMKLALNGVYGQQAQQTAARYQQQATIIQDELGQTFMGGNSPTDKALSLAGSVLNTNWSATTLNAALDQLDQNLTYRVNAINTPQVGGLGGDTSPYLPGSSSTDYTGTLDSLLQQMGGQ